jgi:hypothetical protein
MDNQNTAIAKNPLARAVYRFGWMEWTYLAYIVVGLIGAIICLQANGEGRFSAFVYFERFSAPSSYVVYLLGLDEFFSKWPDAVYWNFGLIVLNGGCLYLVLKGLKAAKKTATKRGAKLNQ